MLLFRYEQIKSAQDNKINALGVVVPKKMFQSKDIIFDARYYITFPSHGRRKSRTQQAGTH